jgi:CRP/FNR family transcriptional regulator, cyclic AMP receptor protein
MAVETHGESVGETKGPMGSPHSIPDDAALIRQALSVTKAFAAWPPAPLERLLRVARRCVHVRGELVHSEEVGEPEILTVVSGHLRVTRLASDGPRVPISVLGPGHVIGIPRGLVPHDRPGCDYHAHDDAVIVHFPARVLFEVLDDAPHLWKPLTLMLVRQHGRELAAAIDHLGGSLRRRLAATIARLAQANGVDDVEMTLRLRLSQDDLAALLQASRGAINREMRAIEALGLVRADYGTVAVRDLPGLLRLGDVGPPADNGQEVPETPQNSPADIALVRQGLALNASFAGWPAAAIEALLPSARLVRYRRGARVRSERGKGKWEALVVLSGHVLRSRPHADGSRTPFFIFHPGLVAGMQNVLESSNQLLQMYEAYDDAVVVHLLGRAIVERLEAQPALWGSIAPPMAMYSRLMTRALMAYQAGSTRQRVAATLAYLAQMYGAGDDTRCLRLQVSQDDLATLLQVSRQSINREMRAFEAQGLVEGEYGAVSILQLQALRQLGRGAADESA